MVHLALCTKGEEPNRQYLFKFYPQKKEGVSLTEDDLDCSDKPAGAVWIPVAATIGGEGNWGEGYTDPNHKIADRLPNFGEGKLRRVPRHRGSDKNKGLQGLQVRCHRLGLQRPECNLRAVPRAGFGACEV